MFHIVQHKNIIRISCLAREDVILKMNLCLTFKLIFFFPFCSLFSVEIWHSSCRALCIRLDSEISAASHGPDCLQRSWSSASHSPDQTVWQIGVEEAHSKWLSCCECHKNDKQDKFLAGMNQHNLDVSQPCICLHQLVDTTQTYVRYSTYTFRRERLGTSEVP